MKKIKDLTRKIRNSRRRLERLTIGRMHTPEAQEAFDGSPSAMEYMADLKKEISKLVKEISNLETERAKLRNKKLHKK
jgi:hypothetical protein